MGLPPDKFRLPAYALLLVLALSGCTGSEDLPGNTTSIASPTSASQPATTATSSPGEPHQPPFPETTALAAADRVQWYFKALRSADPDAFARLFTQEDRAGAADLYAAEKARMEADQPAFALRSARNLMRQGGRWFLDPGRPVPSGLQGWVDEKPAERMLVLVTLMDGSARFFQVQLDEGGEPFLLLAR